MIEVRCSCGRLILKKIGESFHILTPSSLREGTVEIVCPRCKHINKFVFGEPRHPFREWEKLSLALRKAEELSALLGNMNR